MEQVAESVLVFVTVQTAPDRAAFLRNARPVRLAQGRREFLEKALPLHRLGLRLLLRRHLALPHAIVHLHPPREDRAV